MNPPVNLQSSLVEWPTSKKEAPLMTGPEIRSLFDVMGWALGPTQPGARIGSG